MYKVERIYDAEAIRPYAMEFTSMIEVECDPDYYINTWKDFLANDVGLLYALYHNDLIVGGIGGLLAPDLFTGKTTLIELFWYVTPSHRSHGIMLFREMEKYATDNKIRWAMVHMENSMPEKLKRFYTKNGFKLLETHWIKGD